MNDKNRYKFSVVRLLMIYVSRSPLSTNITSFPWEMAGELQREQIRKVNMKANDQIKYIDINLTSAQKKKARALVDKPDDMMALLSEAVDNDYRVTVGVGKKAPYRCVITGVGSKFNDGDICVTRASDPISALAGGLFKIGIVKNFEEWAVGYDDGGDWMD